MNTRKQTKKANPNNENDTQQSKIKYMKVRHPNILEESVETSSKLLSV